MKLAISQSGWARSWDAAWAAGLFLTLALCAVVLEHAPLSSRVSHRRDSKSILSTVGAAGGPESGNRSEVRNYFMNFAGDHSLDVATVIEQPSSGYTQYTVQLHLASGAEQSVIVSAPPGGLQIEMHDMTGDKVPNDVILRPTVVRWLPTVLVNDGHEHFEVAVSGTNPKSFSTGEDLGSRRRDSQTFALLVSSGFKAIHLPNNRRLFDPQLQECPSHTFTQTGTNRFGHALSPGRAPPVSKAI
jgi:hypothetical protein